MPPTLRRPSLRTLVLLWCVLAVSFFALNALRWFGRAGAESGPLTPIANAASVLMLPGWIAMRAAFGRAGHTMLSASISASAIAAACWTLGIALALECRARLARSRPECVRVDVTRRRFLTDASLAAGALVSGGGIAQATLIEPWRVVNRPCRVVIDGLPAEFDGFRIVFASDIHFGPRIHASFVKGVVEQALALSPDLFILGGDYVHYSAESIDRAAELLAPLAAPGAARFGALGVLGNHDWYADGPRMRSALEGVGVRMIDNTRVFLSPGEIDPLGEEPEGPALCIAGAGDLHEDTVLINAALSGVKPRTPRIYVSHNPDLAEMRSLRQPLRDGAHPRIDLMLSGHTHGGQVRLPFVGAPIVPSAYGQKYVGGLVQGPACRVLVSRGVGMSILPVRFGVPPEIVELTLVRRA